MSEQKQALTMKQETADKVADKVKILVQQGELFVPSNYSPDNALKSAWLILQNTEDMNKKKALEVCTPDSIANSLFSMVIQGLNPDKKQCYFIVYGNQLQMQRSYFGSIAVAKMANPKVDDIIGDIVYDGDEVVYEKRRGKTIITKHTQVLENIDRTKIKAAYASVLYTDGTEESIIMTMDQIKQSWKQSKTYPVDDKGGLKATSTHAKFTEEMAKKTVINKIAKMIINTSDDSTLLGAFNKTEDIIIESEANARIEENANKQSLDIDLGAPREDDGPVIDIDLDTGEIIKPEQEEQAQDQNDDNSQIQMEEPQKADF